MARNLSVLQLIQRGQYRSDTQEDDHLLTDEWKTMLSSVYAQMYQMFIESGFRVAETTQNLTTTGTSATFAIPGNHMSTIGVDYEYGGHGERRELAELMAQERNLYTGFAGGNTAQAYALVGNSLVLYPMPNAGQKYYHVYIPQPPDLSTAADDDSVDVVTSSGEEYVVWSLAVIAKHKSNEDIRDAERHRNKYEAEVREWATLRSLHNHKRTQVNENEMHNYAGDWRFQR